MKITLIDSMGSDLSVVNAAKVSFDKHATIYSGALTEAGEKLIAFLARGCTSGDWKDHLNRIENSGFTAGYHADKFARAYMEKLINHLRNMPTHWSPFAHTAVTLHIKMPIFVARQLMKHTTGIEYNEISRRYVDSEPDFYFPDKWRAKASNVKQGSSDEELKEVYMQDYSGGYKAEPGFTYSAFTESVKLLYNSFINSGMAPEQARMILPQSMYTEVIATGNLYAWANMYIQRTDSHAQQEIRELVTQMGPIMENIYPVSWRELTK